MVLSKLDWAILAVIGGAMLWIEQGHRIIIGAPAAAAAAPRAASVCPDSDSVPFSADCIAFIGGGALVPIAARPRAAASLSAPSADAQERGTAQGPPCPPSNENAPYSAKCIKFLSGWYWQPNPTASAP